VVRADGLDDRGDCPVLHANIDQAITILVISCPCAIILATPTAMVAAISAAARLGILVKNVAYLEVAGKMTALVFDKTGTVTTGRSMSRS